MRIQELSLLESSIIDLTRHHAGLRSRLERASELAAVVVLEQRPPSCRAFLSLRRLFLEFSLESQSYLDLEETALLPALRGGNGWEKVTDLAETIRLLRFGQQAILSLLSDMCEATQGFETPAEACPVYGEFLDVLRGIQSAVLKQFHLENQEIFPNASALSEAS